MLGKRRAMETEAYVPYPKRTKSYRKAVRRAAPVRRQASGEVKFLDTAIDAANITVAAGTNIPTIVAVPQGVDESERVGRKCTVRSVHVKASLNTSATDPDGIFRMIIYQDKQTNKAAAPLLDIVQTISVNAFRNLTNTGRFNILMDKRLTVNASAAVGNAATFATVRRSIMFNKTCEIPLEFVSSTPSVADLSVNNIGIWYLVDGGPADTWDIVGTARIRYTDN